MKNRSTVSESCFLLSIFFILGAVQTAYTQNCVIGAGVIRYIVRDANGKIMSPSKLTANTIAIETIDLTEKAGTDPKKLEVLSYGRYHPQGCGLNDESFVMTLKYKGKTMSLVFKGIRGYRRVQADSLPFQKGRFEIVADAERDATGTILATGWKKVPESK